MKNIFYRNIKPLLVVALGLMLVSCAAVSTTETAYVFAPEQAIDNPFPADPFCPDKGKHYRGPAPAYYAQYKPGADLTATIRLAPLQPVTYSGQQYRLMKIAVYPAPFKPGYFFTPVKMWLEVGGQTQQPLSVIKKFTQDHNLQQHEHGITREKLAAHSGEYLVYVLEYSIDAMPPATAVLHVGGFDLNGKLVADQAFTLSLNESTLLDWNYTPDCVE